MIGQKKPYKGKLVKADTIKAGIRPIDKCFPEGYEKEKSQASDKDTIRFLKYERSYVPLETLAKRKSLVEEVNSLRNQETELDKTLKILQKELINTKTRKDAYLEITDMDIKNNTILLAKTVSARHVKTDNCLELKNAEGVVMIKGSELWNGKFPKESQPPNEPKKTTAQEFAAERNYILDMDALRQNEIEKVMRRREKAREQRKRSKARKAAAAAAELLKKQKLEIEETLSEVQYTDHSVPYQNYSNPMEPSGSQVQYDQCYSNPTELELPYTYSIPDDVELQCDQLKYTPAQLQYDPENLFVDPFHSFQEFYGENVENSNVSLPKNENPPLQFDENTHPNGDIDLGFLEDGLKI